MNNKNIYDYQNQVLNNTEHFQDNGVVIEEPFTYLNNDLILKTILFGMLFYIVNNPVISHYLTKNFRNLVEVNLLQTVIFAMGYYVMSLYL